MALHARLFTHNILRVSKLKKWSHTTQAIDRNSERSSIALCPQKTNGLADQEKAREADVLQSDTCSQTPPSPPWSLQPCCLDLLDSITPACHQPTHREGAVCWTSQPALGLLAKDTLKTQELSLTGIRYPQDYLPLIVKSVGYTTDDITTCPVDREHHVEHEVIYENHVVTMLTECSKDEQRPFSTAKDISRKSRLCTSEETDTSLLHRNHFRRHSSCDSNPTRRQLFSIDLMLQCRGQSGSDTVFYNPVSDPDVVLCSSESGSSITQSGGEGQKSAGKGPNLDKLRAVETAFIEMVPKFFKSRLDYSLYHPEIVFENNFWGENKVTVGLNQYAMQLTKLRALTHLKYAHVHMEVVSSACLPEEGVIRIQWRVIGLSQFKAMRFWKYTAWNYSKAFREDAEWIEGISVLHVNKEGLVTKHRLDRMTPSEEQLAKAPSLAAKLALLFGLSAPKPSLSDCSSFLCRQ